METLIILILFTAVVIIDLLPFKKRPKKQNIVYCVLLILSFTVLFLDSVGVEIPSPSGPITQLIEPLIN